MFIIETQGELEAWLPRLADLHSRAAYAMDVTNTEVAFREAVNGQILTEPTGYEQLTMLRILTTPCGVVRCCISVDRLLRSSMDALICLLVAQDA